MPDHLVKRDRGRTAREPGPARLYTLVAGALLALLGVLGFFYDAGFHTGTSLSADDVAGIIVVNGWRNVVYLLSGLLALAFASRHPRRVAGALALFYLVIGAWGALETDHDIGSILQILPLTNSDNIFHLLLGGLGAIATLADGPLPKLPAPKPRTKRKRRAKPKSPRREPGRKPLPPA